MPPRRHAPGVRVRKCPPDCGEEEDARLRGDLLLWPSRVTTDSWTGRLRTNPTSLREYRRQPLGHDSSIADAPATDRESVTEIASASPQCEGLVRAAPQTEPDD